MILSALRRTVIRWLLIAVAFIVLLSAINYGLSYLPFTPQFNARRAVAKVAVLEGQVSSLERTAEGNATIGQAVDTYHTREVVIRDVTSQAINEARTAPDADTPLAAGRAGLFRGHDDSLCDPTAVCGTIADLAGRGSRALPPPDPAP